MHGIARFWAGLDLVITGLLVLPPVARIFVAVIHRLSGEAPPEISGVGLFFVCLSGTLGVLWAGARLRDPVAPLVRADVVGRTWVSALIAWCVFAEGAPVALLAFVVTELAGAVHQGIALRA